MNKTTLRTLRTWRTQALRLHQVVEDDPRTSQHMGRSQLLEILNRILRMTQELMDQQLIREEKKRND